MQRRNIALGTKNRPSRIQQHHIVGLFEVQVDKYYQKLHFSTGPVQNHINASQKLSIEEIYNRSANLNLFPIIGITW
jgi:hypothetical protein